MYKNKIPLSNLTPGGVFETMRSYEGRIFRLKEHVERFFESCNSAARKAPCDKPKLAILLRNALAKSKLKEAHIRLALYGGNHKPAEISLLIRPFKSYPGACYRKGVSLITSVVKKSPAGCVCSKIKSSNFLAGVIAKAEVAKSRGFEPMLLNEKGIVAEGAVSNIFIIKEGVLMTSPVSAGLLRGITRGVVLELADKLGIGAKESLLTRHDIYIADEAFITNTIMEIVPVVGVDGRKVGKGRPGAITKKLMEEFKNETRRKEG